MVRGERSMPGFRAGLTLLELMVSIAIAAMVALLLATSVRLVVVRFADETGIRAEGGREDRARTLLRSQLAWMELESDHTPRRFHAAHDGVEFRTMLSAAAPHERTPVVARYAVETVAGAPETQRLVYRERVVSGSELDRETEFERVGASAETTGVFGDRSTSSADEGRVVLEGAKSISFEYLSYVAGGPVWLPGWTEPDLLPRGVRVRIEEHSGEVTAWVLPVVVTF
jgi:prepilin-type N-terminal cleavage/methylation domain-containing protein